MRILCVNPPEYGYMEWIFRVFGSSMYRIGSYYKRLGHDVQVFNMRQEIWDYQRDYMKPDHTLIGNRACGNWENEHISRPLFRIGFSNTLLIDRLVSFKPDKVLVSGMFTYLWEGVKEVIDTVRMFSPDSDIVLGGIYPTLCLDHAKHMMNANIVTGKNQDIDFSSIDIGLYDEVPHAIDILTSIGCPNSCSYCAVHTLEGHARICRDPYDIADEIEQAAVAGVKEFRFLDSNFMTDYDKHFGIIMREVIQRGLDIEFMAYGGVDAKFTTTAQLTQMREAGFEYINIPVETTSKQLLKSWGRSLSVSRWVDIVTDAQKSGLDIGSFMMIGCPGQTITDIRETKSFITDLGVTPIVLPFTPIPGTREFKVFEDMGIPYSLESLHPLLFPLAHNDMTVRDLDTVLQEDKNGVAGCLSEHSVNCKLVDLELSTGYVS